MIFFKNPKQMTKVIFFNLKNSFFSKKSKTNGPYAIMDRRLPTNVNLKIRGCTMSLVYRCYFNNNCFFFKEDKLAHLN